MSKQKLSPQKRADRALCPVSVAGFLGMKVHRVARFMRQAGVSEPLTNQTARAWRARPDKAPEWFCALLAEKAAREAQNEHRERTRELEHEHRMLVLQEKVERRLLAGARVIRGHDAELIAADIAFRAMKELVRCEGDVSWLLPIDLAALRWAGVDPANHATWFIHRGDCTG